MASKKTRSTDRRAAERKREKTARKPLPIPPEKRGRRGHRAVDEQPGLREWLIENYCKAVPKPTLNEIREKLKGTEFSIGRTAISDFDLQFRLLQADKQFLLDLAKQYNDTQAEGQVLDMEATVGTLGAARILAELLRSAATGADLTDRDLKLLDYYRKLQTSSSSRERTRFQVDRGRRATMLQIRAQAQEILKKDPDLQRRFLIALDKAAQEVAK